MYGRRRRKKAFERRKSLDDEEGEQNAFKSSSVAQSIVHIGV